MTYWAAVVTAALFGAIIGYLQTFVFARIPESWLQDYGVKETDPDYRVSKRMKLIPHGVLSALFCSCIYTLFAVFCFKSYINPASPFHIIAILAATPVIIIVMMSDRLNRIIPDQCSVFLAVVGLLLMIGDFFEKNIWFSDQVKWYIPLLNRVLAALIGGGALFVINFICLTFLGKEGMGQGDMKLLCAIGLITGCYGLIVVIYTGIITALFFAVPLLIKKYARKAKEKKEIENAEDPAAKRREIARRKAQIHFADDPDYLAFGPFLAFGAALFMALEPYFYNLMIGYLIALNLYF